MRKKKKKKTKGNRTYCMATYDNYINNKMYYYKYKMYNYVRLFPRGHTH